MYVLFGIAFGLVDAPIATTAISGMPDSQAGVAASVASASRQTGAALGVAIADRRRKLVPRIMAGPR